MIRRGAVCRNCTAGKCRNKPSPQQPMQVDCPRCEREGCPACDERGYFELTDCPKTMVGKDAAAFIRFAELWKQGRMPVAGAVLDQSAWFIDAVTTYDDDTQRIENLLSNQ